MIFHIEHHQNEKGIIYLFYSTMLSPKNVFENHIAPTNFNHTCYLVLFY